MQQYTTEWAKDVLRLFPQFQSIAQIKPSENGTALIILSEGNLKKKDVNFLSKKVVMFLPPMLEHPDGWRKSKVDRSIL